MIQLIKFLFAFSFVVLVTACGGGGSGGGGGSNPPAIGSGGTHSYLGTQSPGDVWTWTIDRDVGTFNATNETLAYTYSGTAATMTNGFLQLTINTSTDPGITPGDIAYAIEVPDTLLLIKPAGSGSNVIVAAAQGSCPTANATSNWITMPENAWDPTGDVAYGTADSVVTGSTIDFTVNRFRLDGVALASATPSGTCSAGRINFAAGEVIGMTPSGMFIGDNGPGLGGFVGVEAPGVNIDIVALTASGKEFRGCYSKTTAQLQQILNQHGRVVLSEA